MSKKEYSEFMEIKEVMPPNSLDAAIKVAVVKDITVPLTRVCKKLFFIHVISALFTLSICPQFGVSTIGSIGHGIASVVLPYGQFVCGLFCGAVFMGVTALLSALLFKKAEITVLNRNSIWVFSILATVSVAVLMFIGAFLGGAHQHNMENYSLVFTLSWLVSGIFLSSVIIKKVSFSF